MYDGQSQDRDGQVNLDVLLLGTWNKQINKNPIKP